MPVKYIRYRLLYRHYVKGIIKYYMDYTDVFESLSEESLLRSNTYERIPA